MEEVFQVCGEAIEHEMDPNSFAPFLGLEKPEAAAAGAGTLPQGSASAPRPAEHKQRRQSMAVQQSKRLSSRPVSDVADAAPVLRGGMYVSLSFFSQQGFFDKNGAVAPRSSEFRLLSSSPQVVAEQWTLLEHFLFSKVKRSDFLVDRDDAAARMSSRDINANSSLTQLKQFQWHMMDWCISQVVDSASVDTARLKISFLLDVSVCMESFRNFNGMFEIFTVLQTTSIFRLKEVWASLKSSSASRAETLKALFNSTDSFAKFRSYLHRFSDLRDKPTVPYLGLYLKDLVHLQQLPSAAPGLAGLVNMIKMTSLSAQLLDLHAFQQIPYRFSPDFPVISGLFSQPRLRTEEEQFQASTKLCPV